MPMPHFLRLIHTGTLTFILLATVGCGKVDDPDPINLSNLKAPSDLRIFDLAGGKVRLSWKGGNFEDEFEGYNVYGAKFSDENISSFSEQGLARGTPLRLINDK